MLYVIPATTSLNRESRLFLVTHLNCTMLRDERSSRSMVRVIVRAIANPMCGSDAFIIKWLTPCLMMVDLNLEALIIHPLMIQGLIKILMKIIFFSYVNKDIFQKIA